METKQTNKDVIAEGIKALSEQLAAGNSAALTESLDSITRAARQILAAVEGGSHEN
jgi:hypothetical protein